ncbi:MAG: hypothetical protein GC204_06600 [Chloroflexi bacterium]|nr:hypothetical protein [Chloroflexota bacterium]
MKRILLAVMLVMILMASIGAAAAQETHATIRPIPVTSKTSMMKLSPDDHTLAVFNNALIYDEAPTPDLTAITLIDLESGDTIDTLSGYSDWVTDVAFNADGSKLVSFHRNGDVLLWDMTTKTLIKTIPTYNIGGSWVQFLNDDKTVLYRAGELVIGLLDTETGAITHLFGRHIDSYQAFSETYAQFPGRGDITFAAAAVSPDDQKLVVSTQNDEVLLWDIASGNEVTLRPPSEKFGQLAIRAFAFSADSKQMAYFDQGDQKMHVWDVAKRTEQGTLDGGSISFAASPDGTQLAWADRENNSISLIDTAISNEATKLAELPDTTKVVPTTSLAFTSDGKQIVVGGLFAPDEENAIYVIDLAG